MKVKLGILANDTVYLKRFVSFLTSRYQENFEVYSFTEAEIALQTARTQKIDILLVEESCDINTEEFLNISYVIYFVESRDVETVCNCPTIFKYQKTELIVKNIWNFYSEVVENTHKSHRHINDDCKIFAFASPCGGSGSSTVAAACALYFAQCGKKVIYLNLEKIGASDVFFCGEGTQTLSDMIFAVKSKKTNLLLKMEACLKHDVHNVSFFSQTNQVLDMYEMSTEEQIEMINMISDSNTFDIIVLDLDFSLTAEQKKIYLLADRFIMTSDGTDVHNHKIERVFNALSIQEQGEKFSLLENSVLIYNKFNNAVEQHTAAVSLNTVGTIPIISNMQSSQIPVQLSKYGFWKNL